MKALYTQHSKLTSQYIDQKLNDFLIEDHADTDLTTRVTLLNKPSIAIAKIVVEQKLIFVGTDIIKRIFNDADINILVSPDKFQPVKYKIRPSGEDKLQIFTGGVIINGSSFIVKEMEISEKINLTMKEGSYESNFPAFLFHILN